MSLVIKCLTSKPLEKKKNRMKKMLSCYRRHKRGKTKRKSKEKAGRIENTK